MNDWVAIDPESKDTWPMDGQAVLVRYGRDNWHRLHFLADESPQTIWRWKAAEFKILDPEVWHEPNNLTSYEWDEFGPGKLFGQDVTHWFPIYEVKEPERSTRESGEIWNRETVK